MDNTDLVTRRKLLSSISTAGMVAITGCVSGGESQGDIEDSDGDGVIDSEDYAPRDPEVQERSDVQNPQTETGTPTETETATQTETETATQTETETATQTESYEIERDALVNFRAGKNSAERADGAHTRGLSEYNEETDDYGETEFRTAVESSKSSVDRYERAADLAEESGHSEAAEMAQESASYAQEILVYFSEVALEAAQAKQRGDTAEVEQHNRRLKHINEEADKRKDNDNSGASIIEFREALGL